MHPYSTIASRKIVCINYLLNNLCVPLQAGKTIVYQLSTRYIKRHLHQLDISKRHLLISFKLIKLSSPPLFAWKQSNTNKQQGCCSLRVIFLSKGRAIQILSCFVLICLVLSCFEGIFMMFHFTGV
jgi:hypothetical protein